jgi:hypothetical protein
MKVSLTPDRLKTFEVRMPNRLFFTLPLSVANTLSGLIGL